MAGYREYVEQAMRLNNDPEPRPYAVAAGGVEPRGNIMQQLQSGMNQRMQNGPWTNPAQIRIPQNASMFQLAGLFGGPPQTQPMPVNESTDPRTMTNGMTDAPSPGLGSGVPNSFMFEDGSQAYPGNHQDALMTLLTQLLNRRFPNN